MIVPQTFKKVTLTKEGTIKKETFTRALIRLLSCLQALWTVVDHLVTLLLPRFPKPFPQEPKLNR